MRSVRVSGAVALVFAAAACNLLSGVGDLTIDDSALAAPDRDSAIVDDDSSAGDANVVDGGPGTSDGAASNQLFFLASTSTDAGALRAYPGIVALTGGVPRAIGCTTEGAATAFQASPPVGGTTSIPNGPYLVGNFTSRVFGSTFLYADTPSTNDTGAALLAANDGTGCASNPPRRIDRGDQNVVPVFPRFSPSGARVAYIEQASNRASRVVTVSVNGPDGGAANVIRTGADVDAGNGAALWLAPPTWLADDELVWVESASAPTYLPQTIRRAKDTASPSVQTLSTCSRYIEQLEVFSRNGARHAAMVSAAQSWTQQNGATTTTLGVFDIAETCTSAKTLVADTSSGTVARDVAVSPDGAFIAFAANLDTPSGSRSLASPLNVFVVDSLGNAQPVRCSDPDVSTDELAPQWLANGTKLVWVRASRSSEARESIWVADIANGVCTNPRAILDDEQGGTRYVTQANAGLACGVSTIRAGRSWPSAMMLSAVLVLCARRRRRRDRVCS